MDELVISVILKQGVSHCYWLMQSAVKKVSETAENPYKPL